jgi:hypothetical protein
MASNLVAPVLFGNASGRALAGVDLHADEFYWSTCDLRSDHFVLAAFLTPAIVLVIVLVAGTAAILVRARRRGKQVSTLIDEWFASPSVADRDDGSTPDDYGSLQQRPTRAENWSQYLDEERTAYAQSTERELQQERAEAEERAAEERRRRLRLRHKKRDNYWD